jgi:hypothetical protein
MLAIEIDDATALWVFIVDVMLASEKCCDSVFAQADRMQTNREQ